MKILLLYYTKTGHTLEAVKAVAEGIRSAGNSGEIVRVREFRASMLTDCDALIVGSPCWAGSITPGGVAGPVTRILKALPSAALDGMRCGGVSVHSGFGGKTTIATLGRMLADKGCTDYRPGPAARAGSPFSIWKGPDVKAPDLARFRDYGSTFAG